MPAPQAALEYLRTNPQLWRQFKQKYGQLPDGFSPPGAPAGALDYLQKNPSLSPQFEEKYGYLPPEYRAAPVEPEQEERGVVPALPDTARFFDLVEGGHQAYEANGLAGVRDYLMQHPSPELVTDFVRGGEEGWQGDARALLLRSVARLGSGLASLPELSMKYIGKGHLKAPAEMSGALREEFQNVELATMDALRPEVRRSVESQFVERADDGSLKFGEGADDPWWWTGMAIDMGTQMAPGIGAAGKAARIAYGARYSQALAKAAAAKAGTRASIRYAEKEAVKAAQRAAILAGGSAEGLIAGGQASADVQRTLSELDEETMMNYAPYAQMREQGASHESARQKVADDQALKAGLAVAAATGMLGIQLNAFIGKWVSRASRVKSRVGAAATGVALEGGQEFFQEGSQQYFQNLSQSPITGQDPWEGVLESAITGAVVGGGLGGAIGGAAGPEARQAPTDFKGRILAKRLKEYNAARDNLSAAQGFASDPNVQITKADLDEARETHRQASIALSQELLASGKLDSETQKAVASSLEEARALGIDVPEKITDVNEKQLSKTDATGAGETAAKKAAPAQEKAAVKAPELNATQKTRLDLLNRVASAESVTDQELNSLVKENLANVSKAGQAVLLPAGKRQRQTLQKAEQAATEAVTEPEKKAAQEPKPRKAKAKEAAQEAAKPRDRFDTRPAKEAATKDREQYAAATQANLETLTSKDYGALERIGTGKEIDTEEAASLVKAGLVAPREGWKAFVMRPAGRRELKAFRDTRQTALERAYEPAVEGETLAAPKAMEARKAAQIDQAQAQRKTEREAAQKAVRERAHERAEKAAARKKAAQEETVRQQAVDEKIKQAEFEAKQPTDVMREALETARIEKPRRSKQPKPVLPEGPLPAGLSIDAGAPDIAVDQEGELPANAILTSEKSYRGALRDMQHGRPSKAKGPLEVWKTEDGRYLLTDGQHRFAEGVSAGKQSFRVKVVGEGYTDYWKTPGRGEEFVLPKRSAMSTAGTLRFRHFSNLSDDEVTLDPGKQGTGIPGAERRRGGEKVIALYAGDHPDSMIEHGLRDKTEYEVEIDRADLYDANEDARGFIEQASADGQFDMNEFEKLVKTAGFKGYHTPQAEGVLRGQARLFGSTTARRLKKKMAAHVEEPAEDFTPLSVPSVREAVADIEQAFGFKISVVFDWRSFPASVHGIPGAKLAIGLFHASPLGGEVFISAARTRSAERARVAAIHEIVGHFGLRGVLGDRYTEVMESIWESFPEQVVAVARRNRIDLLVSDQAQLRANRLAAAEELVAYATEQVLVKDVNAQQTVWQRIVQFIRDALRSMGVIRDMNKADIRDLILRSRDYVRSGREKRVRVRDFAAAKLWQSAFTPNYTPLRAGERLAGMPASVELPGRGQVSIGPYEVARAVARKYMRQQGWTYQPVTNYLRVNEERSKRIAKSFEEMPHAPNDPKVKAAYDALIRETLAQYRVMKETGLKVEFIEPGQPDPYAASPRYAIPDVVENNHLWVFPTESGFGSSSFDPAANPLLTETDEFVGNRRLLANDVFRIVHDYFGHVKEGVGFRADGEENAWRSHASMFSPLARAAMTTETRGQNSWVNFGPYGEQNRAATSEKTKFADQKIGLLPEEFWSLDEETSDEMESAFSIAPPPIRYQVERGGSFEMHSVISENGTTKAARRGNTLQVFFSGTGEQFQRRGEGLARMQELARIAEEKGLRLVSDSVVSPLAAKVYDRLERLGYVIKRNEFEVHENGDLLSVDTRPIFEVVSTPGSDLMSAASFSVDREIDSQEFQSWFSGSKVVDTNGRPLIVYHGTDEDEIRSFDKGLAYFTDDRDGAGRYGQNIMRFYLRIENPYITGESLFNPSVEFIEELKRQGHDGIVSSGEDEGERYYITFYSQQVRRLDQAAPAEAAFSIESVPAEIAQYMTDEEKDLVKKRTVQKLIDMFRQLPSDQEMAAVALAGQAKRGWYRRSAKAIGTVFGPDAPRFVALLAALSPQVSVESNLRNALNTWVNWVAVGRPTTRGAIFKILGQSVEGTGGRLSVLPAWINNSVRALSSEDPETVQLSGPKVNSFAANLRNETNEVTIDTWMASYALVEQKLFRGQQRGPEKIEGKAVTYIAYAARVRAAADRLSKITGEKWTPSEVQETIWSWAKALSELAESYGPLSSAREIIENKELTDDLINSTPDFAGLFSKPEFAGILAGGGYSRRLGRLAKDQAEAGAGAKTAPSPEGFGESLKSAADRLDRVIQQRRDQASQPAEAAFSIENEPVGETYVVREIGAHRSNVILSTNDKEEARAKLRLLIAQDPEGKYSIETIPAPDAFSIEEEPDFQTWFSGSKVTDSYGNPRTVYHGTRADISKFAPVKARDSGSPSFGFHFGTLQQAERRAGQRGMHGQNIMPIHLSIKNPLRARDAGDWSNTFAVWDALNKATKRQFEDLKFSKEMQKAEEPEEFSRARDEQMRRLKDRLVSLGYDGVVYKNRIEGIGDSYVALESSQIRSAVSGHAFSLNGIPTGGDPNLESFLSKIGAKPKTLKQRWQELTSDLGDRANMALFDHFFGIKRAEQLAGISAADSGYVSARLSTSGASLMRATLEYGYPIWEDGAPNIAGGNGFFDIIKPLGDNVNTWLAWMVAGRADRLMSEGREHLFTPAEIAAARRLGDNNPAFLAAAQEYAEFKSRILDFAQEAGIVNPDTRALWDNADYIPFYRLMENGEIKSQGVGGGLGFVRNQIRKLKGGEQNLGDPLENIMKNWANMLEASIRAHAARLTIDNLDGTGLVTPTAIQSFTPEGLAQFKQSYPTLVTDLRSIGVDIDALTPASFRGIQSMLTQRAPEGQDTVSVWRDGVREFWNVHDPLLFRSLQAINPKSWTPLMNVLRAPKRFLTETITIVPEFSVKNIWRDMWSVFVQGRNDKAAIPIIPIIDSVKGLAEFVRKGEVAQSMMAGGASFEGTGYNSQDAAQAARRAARLAGVTTGIVDTPMKAYLFYRDMLSAAENAHRVVVHNRVIARGGTRKEALYEAKDLMDFSLRGNSPVVRFLAETVPFWGARVAGLSTLGRRFKADPIGVAIRGSLLALASLAYVAMNFEDERYKALTPDQKNLYWHIFDVFEEGDHWRIPKPFEVGTIFGTIPEAIMDAILTNADEPDRALASAKLVGHAFSEALDLSPQVAGVWPVVELAINENTFTGAPILTMGDEGVLPEDQDSPGVRPTYRFLAHAMPDAAPEAFRSPKQLQHLGRGYIGSLQDYVLLATDKVARAAMGEPAPAEKDVGDQVFFKSFVDKGPARNTKYLNEMYRIADEAEKVYRSLNRAAKGASGDARVEELLTEQDDLLSVRKSFRKAIDQVNGIRSQQRTIQVSDMSPEEKKQLLDELNLAANEIAMSVWDLRPGGKLSPSTAVKLMGVTKQQQVSTLRKNGLSATAELVESLPATPPAELMRAVGE